MPNTKVKTKRNVPKFGQDDLRILFHASFFEVLMIDQH